MKKTYYIIQIISGNDSLTSHNLNATKDRSRKVANAARRSLSPSVESRRLFLKDCDFEAHNGRGEFVTTASKKKAIKFTTMEAALKYYKTQSETVPLRWDGQPNRPLTALTVSIEKMTMRTLTKRRKRR